MSQTPIREALSMLEALGLVTKRQFAGYCTAPKLNRKQFEELYEIRLLMEPYAAKCAAERMKDAQMAEISALAKRMEPGESRASYDRFADDDANLHAKIAHASKSSLIEDSRSRLQPPPYLPVALPQRGHNRAFSEHARLVDALQRRSPGEAEAAMRYTSRNPTHAWYPSRSSGVCNNLLPRSPQAPQFTAATGIGKRSAVSASPGSRCSRHRRAGCERLRQQDHADLPLEYLAHGSGPWPTSRGVIAMGSGLYRGPAPRLSLLHTLESPIPSGRPEAAQ